MNHHFFGGVHPAGRESLTDESLSTLAPLPQWVVIPMRQHIGVSCKPLVTVGDRVKYGQKIGDGAGLCVPVHASVSGTVEEIREYPHPGGKPVLSVIIRNDYLDTPAQELTAYPEPEHLSPEALLRILREAGIVGMGGAAFPTYKKASSGIGTVDTLIANACECEPYITADDALLRTCPEAVLRGLSIMQRLVSSSRTVFAIEDNKKECIRILQKLLKDMPSVELAVLSTRYPQGAEKQLIQAVTGREVPPGELPPAIGCLVFNIATLSAVYQAVCEGRPMLSRIVTVTGDGVRKPKNFIARIGTPFAALIEAAGGLTEHAEKVIAGGPMMGIAQSDLSVPIIKSTNAILVLELQQNGESARTTCIRCGRCVAACPVRLQPLYLYGAEVLQDYTELDRLHAVDCIECGCCSYICPAKLPLTEHIRHAKRSMRRIPKR